MPYNLDQFELFVVSIPRTRRVLGYLVGVGTIAGLLTTGALGAESLGADAVTALSLVGVFVGSALLAGEVCYRLVGSYPRNWAYYLATVTLAVTGVFVPLAVLAGGTADRLWFALGVAFLLCFQILVVSDGLGRFWLLGGVSAVQPAALFLGLGATLPAVSLAVEPHAWPVAVVLAAGLGLGLVSVFIEWLMRANVPEVGGLEITSHLVQRAELHLGMGFPMEPPVQTFAVESAAGAGTADAADPDAATEKRGGDSLSVVAPWVHPGILEGIGGGRLSRNLLGALNGGDPTDSPGQDDTGSQGDGANDDGADDDAFFFHVPSTHFSDTADPRVHEPVRSGVTAPETATEASRLVSRTVDGTTFHGRRYGDSRVVYVESVVHADIEVSVFGDVIDPETTLVVDRHVRLDQGGREEVFREAAPVDELRAALRDFLALLEEEPLHPYRAGHAVDLDLAGISLCALVEEVDGERTLVLGADQNESPETLDEVRAELRGTFDETLLFTTDTHASVFDNRFDPQAGPERIHALVEDACASVGPAAAGVGADRAGTIPVMRKDYPRLMFSLNILARVYLLLLASLHVALAVVLLW